LIPETAINSAEEVRLRAVVQELLQSAHTVYLFGSRAAKSANAESDFDIAFLAESSPTPIELFDLRQQLADRLSADVDLVDMRAASTVFRTQVLGNSVLLVDRNPRRRAEFEMFALSDYARLNEERRDILKDFYGEK